jgi:hypothetical protein
MAMTDPSGGCRGEMVRVSRNGGDDPVRCAVPEQALRNPHFTARRGGDYAALDQAVLSAYVDSELVPQFRRGGAHRGGSLLALIEAADNDAEVYERLRARSEEFVPNGRYLRQQATNQKES